MAARMDQYFNSGIVRFKESGKYATGYAVEEFQFIIVRLNVF